ncbi:MAG TPA: KTSC domain-containing protein [Chitinophagaceae bacterium]|nr:KTSC domain-containing protein [Chitinophagaceae bacterium]
MPSSVIARIHYYAATATLEVVFVSGTVYRYKDVPAVVYDAMKSASSKGSFLNKHIKGHYSFEKVA